MANRGSRKKSGRKLYTRKVSIKTDISMFKKNRKCRGSGMSGWKKCSDKQRRRMSSLIKSRKKYITIKTHDKNKKISFKVVRDALYK